MSETIILIYSRSNKGDISDAKAVIRKLRENNENLIVNIIDADGSKDNVQSQYQQYKQKNLCLLTSMVFAIGTKGLDALCILNDARFLDSSRIKVGLLIRQLIGRSSIQVQELQFTLNFLAIPLSTLDCNMKKVIQGIRLCVSTLAPRTNDSEVLALEKEIFVLEAIKQSFQDTGFNRCMHKLASMTQYAELLGLGFIAEAMNQEYLGPTKAACLSGALIFSCIYRNRDKIILSDTSTNNPISMCKPN